MMPAVKHLDPIVGVDIHLIITPPGPVVPIPHPHIGIVFDPFDYIPIIGSTVNVNGLPRAQAGTGGVELPPHFPIGGAFARPPSNENETFMGSATVAVDGDAFTSMMLPVLSCQDIGMPSPPRKRGPAAKTLLLPTSIVLSIPAGPPVIVGGPPTISLMGMLQQLALGALLKGLKKLRKLQKGSRKLKNLSDRLHTKVNKLLDRLGVGDASRLRDFASKIICTVTGHPVDVATGRVLTEAVDWELPGHIPLRFERNYSSSLGWRDSVLGLGWSHSLDLAVWEEGGRAVYRAPDGREIEFQTSQFPGGRLPIGASVRAPVDRLILHRSGAQSWQVEDAEGLTHELRQVPGEPRSGHCKVVRTHDRVGHEILYEYDEQAHLSWVTDTVGRRILFECDTAGRLSRVALPHPSKPIWVTHNRYVYSASGQLLEVQDAMGHSMRFAYDGCLLVRETDRTGFSFYFEYDGRSPDAWCVRTWGDGGIFSHTIKYNKQARVTEVTDSLGHTTTYLCSAHGVVEREIDPLGGEHCHEYDEALRLLSETDALGHCTSYEYDAAGNCTKILGPDGASVSARYNALNLPVEAVDANGGIWRWTYDAHGQLLQEINPLGETKHYEYFGGLLHAVVDRDGARTEYMHDVYCNITCVRLPTGAQLRMEYDKRGRQVSWCDARGCREYVRYDALNRPVRVEGPAQEVCEGRYDAEGNILEAKGPARHVRIGYTGYHWPAYREEAGTRLAWRHDTEGQLIEVSNESGEAYSFTRNALGQVTHETGFDGAVWQFQYDAAGRTRSVISPSGQTRSYTYDAVGRLIRVQYADGGFRAFSYRADGALRKAENESGAVEWEADALGRVIVEKSGDAEITSAYSPAGHRVETKSSLGAHQQLLRDALGETTGVTYASQSRKKWSAHIERDAGGLEIARWMPGEVLSTWRHDEAGQPLERRTQVGTRTATLRTYRWRAGGLLSALFDPAHGSLTEYHHDARGRLVEVKEPDGSRRYRAMDAVGNLYQHPKKGDRRYGSGGRLLEAGPVRYTYDADGNLIEKSTPEGPWRYSWNGAGLLSEVQRPDGLRVLMTYDALARRTSKRVLGQDAQGKPSLEREVRFVWDGQVVLHELNSLEHLTTWVFEPDSFSPLAKEDVTGCYAVVTDHLGTPTEMYNELGQLAWKMQLDAFGAGRPDVTLQHCPWRWPGQYEDEETGLHYNRFRYYDSQSGRYISQDPLGLEAGPDLYSYPEDPLSSSDPLGLAKKGCKRGPKPWPHGPHNQKIQQRIKDLKKKLGKDWEHTHGGNLTELVLDTPKGLKKTRRADITFTNKKTGQMYYEQVGKMMADGKTPVPREQKALSDIRSTGATVNFVQYN